MKFPGAAIGGNELSSPPSRGAWIEIGECYCDCEYGSVAPLAGGVD